MAPRKPSPRKAKPGTGLAAAQHYLGLVQNAQGKWVTPNAAQAADYMARVAGNMGYQTNPAYPASTPIANRQGQRIGTFEQSTGEFTLSGRTNAAGSKKNSPRRGKRGGGRGLNEPLSASPYAESDLSTTSYIRTQGKAYAAGRAGSAASLAGQTDKAGAVEENKKAGGRKRKGLLKTRGHRQQSGVKPAFHISKSGKVVPNKGGRKGRPKTK